jgi:N-acetylmuramoyl-L-alanine amidase
MGKWLQDGGHGGSDPGAVAKGNVEKEYTLEASLYVNKRLKEHGIVSSVTRTNDVTLEEDDRVAAVKNSGADFCISHHFNAGGGEGAEFIHSLHSDGAFEQALVAEFRKAGYPLRNRPVFYREGKADSDYYYMHRRTGKVKTTIIEYEFVDGDNANKIKVPSYREGMYECVVRAVCKKEGVSYKPLTEPLKMRQVKVVFETNNVNALKLIREFEGRGYTARMEEL